MHRDRLSDNEAIRDQLPDRLTRVGVGNLAYFVRVEPDLAFSAADHRGREPFLSAEVDPVCCRARVRSLVSCCHDSRTEGRVSVMRRWFRGGGYWVRMRWVVLDGEAARLDRLDWIGWRVRERGTYMMGIRCQGGCRASSSSSCSSSSWAWNPLCGIPCLRTH